MPIKKPSSQSRDNVNTNAVQGIDTVNDKAAEDFINKSATTNPPKPARPKRKVKTQMMMRIDPDLLERIDERAMEEGVSRSAWISRTCARALKSEM